MKNITQYFVDTVKSSEITIRSNDYTKEEIGSKDGLNKKHNRVKNKISRTNNKETECDVIENNNDMIDKTRTPLTKVSNVKKNSRETSKRSSSSKLPSQKFQNEDLNCLLLENEDIFDTRPKSRSEKQNSRNSLNNDKSYKKKLKAKEDTNTDTSLNSSFKNKDDTDDLDLLIIDSDDPNEQEDCLEESNAFKIIMSSNKPMQRISPTKLPSPTDETTRNTEEYRKKIKRSKERLIALADKKGYSKRKLSEIEEGEKVDRIIQNRIKAFKMGEKKDNVSTPVLTQRQPHGILNYFSKTPMNLTHTNISDMSTIVVKADVHMTENSVKHSGCISNSKNEVRPNRKNRSNLHFSQIDDISIIESENINISQTKAEHKQQQNNHKRRWSLRVKLRNCKDENSLSAENVSVEEILSPRSKTKLNMEKSKKSERIKSVCSENLLLNNKSKKSIPKKLQELEQLECEDIIIQDKKHSKTQFENKHKFMSHKCESILTQNKNLTDFVDSNLENVTEVKLNKTNCIINDDNSKRKPTDKLAPLFTKRQKPDPETIAARQLFLQPDITDKSNKNIDRKVNSFGVLPFPSISHVTQLTKLSSNLIDNFDIPEKICNQYVPDLNIYNYKCVIDVSEIKLKLPKNIKKPKVQEVLTEIEKNCPDVREMWNIILFAFGRNSNKAVTLKTKSKRSKQSEKSETSKHKHKSDEIEGCSWTYKYRPKNAKEVVGNEEAAAKLREWLIGWKATFTNENDSSGDEFYSSDSSYSRISGNNQVAVLLGPHGSGKTATVYALAEEFGYTVLEVNASSRRTGKKLLKELEEATKSHRIKKENNAIPLFNSISDEILPKKIPQNSLILIEDIDLVFEEDEGFTSATYQLASNTKRPIIMTCRDVCPHLTKMAPQQNRIYFQSPTGSKVLALLELISLAETGYKLPNDCITELMQSGDLRKAILQLQYLLLSGPIQMFEQSITFKHSFWQNMRHCLYKPAIKASKRQRTKRIPGKNVANDNIDVLNDVAHRLDNIVLLSSLIEVEDSALNLWQINTQPSLSLIENTDPYSVSNNICLNMAEWISKKVMYKDKLNEFDGTRYQHNIGLKKQLNKGINVALSNTTSLVLDRRIMSTDYLPSVRTICRAEECRANINNKRGNRFFHYLHSLKVSSISFQPNILSAACQVMYDKGDNDTRIIKNNSNLI
ncbi:ATPase family AAA domain-containing protein 5 isoform X1 [Hylaeus volcanicus]|uniref:ATPase family AAA domain-containing protein 5 isoform X1 n=2 Tax=Hylaeus volcanicus TaxID=313075 RepID=UPI0023B7B751|nr:ATPase family AAA domain-containing protein 5 isoform X1 [Hylaeus volcanicus]